MQRFFAMALTIGACLALGCNREPAKPQGINITAPGVDVNVGNNGVGVKAPGVDVIVNPPK